jgi:hypothetical protein
MFAKAKLISKKKSIMKQANQKLQHNMKKHNSILKAQEAKDGTKPAISLNPVLSSRCGQSTDS